MPVPYADTRPPPIPSAALRGLVWSPVPQEALLGFARPHLSSTAPRFSMFFSEAESASVTASSGVPLPKCRTRDARHAGGPQETPAGGRSSHSSPKHRFLWRFLQDWEVRAFSFLKVRPSGTRKACVFSTRTVQTPCKTAGPGAEEGGCARTLPLHVLTPFLPPPHPSESLVHSLIH